MEYSLEDGGKTWGEVISMFIIAVLYPGVTMAMTAQTKANAAELLKVNMMK